MYPTEEHRNSHKVKFNLIGHSNGGLVSRYYIENLLGDKRVDKLIAIDTPHFGSWTAQQGLDSRIASTVQFVPMNIDLAMNSNLFTGVHMEFLDGNLFGSLSYIGSQELQYGLGHQSAKLNGNTNVSTKYYAIGGVSYGYDVSSGTKVIEFTANYQSKSDFLSSIISAAALVNINISNLDVTSGDNVIDIATQFGIWLEGNMITQKINFKRTALLITDNEKYRSFMLLSNYRLEGPFWHNDILKQNELGVSVLKFLGE